MSTILDALRKAAERRPTAPGEPGAVEERAPAAVTPPPGLPKPVRTVEPAKLPDQSDRPKAPEVGPAFPPAATPAIATQPEPPLPPIEPPAAAAAPEPPPAPQEGELPPPPGDFPPPDEPSFLPADDDKDARRRKLVRAGMVVVVGIVLGLVVGRRFLPESGTGADDLLSDAVLAKPAAKPVAGGPDTVPPSADTKPVAGAAADGGGKEQAATGEKSRGGRADKQRRDGEKKDGEPSADKASVDKPADASPTTPPAPTDGAPPIAAVAPAQPQQIRPKPAMMPDPAAVTAPVNPTDPGADVAARPPAATPPAVAAASPAVTPPAAVTPPPAVPIALPPPPDDAPALSLLFIQWSSEPARRVASLRQSGGSIYIVHEGDIVQGLRIAVIRPAGVEVQWRGQSFLLPASRN